ncbi:MAG: CHAT domain-containing protein [Bifidobacteriaceae bacterium]|nr:CHAT domain-containing protein [Bifidobacteriaceae bacterium]
MEALLGPQAARLAAPAPLDYQAAIEAIRRSGAVAQYSCPGGIVQGETLYVVWAGADEPPGVARTVLTQAAADRLNLLAGTSLLADRESKQDASGLEREAEAARAMGLTPPGRDPGGLERTRRLAKRTGDLWSALDRDPRSDPAALEVAAALFPPKLMAALDRARDPVSGVPGPLLIAPGARLWNLPWAGLVTSGDGRRLIESARVSLTPSLTALSQGESLANGEGGAGVRRVAAWIPTGGGTVRGAEVERAAIGALFGPQALAGEPEAFLSQWQGADAAIASVHGNAEAGLSHGIDLTAERSLTGADLLGLDVPGVLVVGACWSARVEADGEPHALALIAHARGAANVIGGVYPLPDAPPFPTSRLLTHLYAALGRTDPATALWLAQHEAAAAGALPHTWAGVTCTTVGLGGRRRA